jgi:beta-ureidopropionase / N-carbamoyl-L-amino-acid hydrolase
VVEPNVRNIVPGGVDMKLDIRDVGHETMNILIDRVRCRLERIAKPRAVETRFERFRDDPPSYMSDQCISTAVDAADSCTATAKRLHSAAMHDTANVSSVTDAGLLFAPSADGVSHTPREWTDWDDCATATPVLAGTAARLATLSTE